MNVNGLSSKPDPSITPEGLRALIRANRSLRPGLRRALREDAITFAGHRAERWQFSRRWDEWRTVVRMIWVSDDFLGLALYRLRMALHDAGVPVVPRLLHRICILFFGIRIGDMVVLKEGIYFPHGNVIIDGVVVVGTRTVICPWVTIGVKQASFLAPQIGDGVFIGTGAKIIGNVHIGDGANIGAGAVVVHDVPAQVSVAGVPARPVGRSATGIETPHV